MGMTRILVCLKKWKMEFNSISESLYFKTPCSDSTTQAKNDWCMDSKSVNACIHFDWCIYQGICFFHGQAVQCALQCYRQFFSFQDLYVTNTKDTARQIWKTEPGEICSVLAGGQLFRYWRDLLSPDRELRWYLRVRFPTQSTQGFKEGDDRRKYCWELRWSNWYPSHCSCWQSMFLSEKILLKENLFFPSV